jgi:DNA-binding response OmpR family regulator
MAMPKFCNFIPDQSKEKPGIAGPFLPLHYAQRNGMERILIIDDDPDVLTVLQIILRKKGYQVTTAWQEQQVYDKVASEKPNLIMMDVLLSGADGRHICRNLKNSIHKSIPIIMFSAHPGAQKNMDSCGADDFLAKPFQEKSLLAKIEKHLVPKTKEKDSA